jgi:hypothetical protein
MEIWKDIEGFEGLYQVSNYGKVCSLNHTKKDKRGRAVHYKGKMMKPQPNSKGYLRVLLKKNGKQHHLFVHRLVALHFVVNPSPNEYSVVNHLDSNYLNNNSDNLEWTTIRGNMHHAIQKGRMKRTEQWLKHLRESNEKNGKSVVGTNIETGETISFICLNDCRNEGFEPSSVCGCCKGKLRTHKGYTWRYA